MLISFAITHTITEVMVMHERIRKAREAAGLTREKFAEKLDVSVSYLAELERGRTGISVRLLMKVCEVLDLSADYILFGDERPSDTYYLNKLHGINEKYLPLVDSLLTQLRDMDQKTD